MTTQTKWTVESRSASDGALVVKDENYNQICTIREKAERTYGGDQEKQDQAHATLIAAAPDMAEALAALFRECAMIHRFGGDASNAKEADEAQSNARALLARLGAV